MRPKNRFRILDEVVIDNSTYGIVLDFTYVKEWNTYKYSVDCESELRVCFENELRDA